MKTRQANRLIERLGGVVVRRRGSYHVYRLPGGRTFSIPYSGSHLELSTGVLHRLRRVLAGPPRSGKEGKMNGP